MASVLDRAADFLWRHARLLDRQRYQYLFRGERPAAVLTALRAYQNLDGGFGNALEPDVRCPDSQPVPTEVALRVIDEVGGAGPMVQRLCEYLTSITTAEGGVPFVLPSVRRFPAAPWWQTEDDPPASPNPSASIVGLLLKLGVQHPWVAGATAYCWRHVEQPESEVHTLQAYVLFLENVPDRIRAERAFAALAQRLLSEGLVALDPDAEGYVKKPLDWAPLPTSLCRRLFADDVMAAHLDALVAAQQADGGWPITWPAISAAAEAEWRGWVTVESLKTLKAYGRLGDGRQ